MEDAPPAHGKNEPSTSVPRLVLRLLPLLLAAGGARAQSPPLAVAGRVVRADAPAAGIAVTAQWIAFPDLPGSLVMALTDEPYRTARATTDAKGEFRIEVPWGPFRIEANADQGESSPPVFPVLPGDYVELALTAQPYLDGEVVDEHGTPMPDVWVSPEENSNLATSRENHRCPKEHAAVRADARGRFRLPVPPRGTSLLPASRSLRAWNEQLATVQRFYRPIGLTDLDTRLVLARGCVLRGQVVNQHGQPISGALVWEPSETGARARTDADGRYALHTPARFAVIEAPGLARQGICARDDDDALGPIALHPGVCLALHLRDGSGPLADRRVLLASPVENAQHRAEHVPWLARTGADGRLAIEGLTPGLPLCAFVEIDGAFRPFLCTVPRADADLGEIAVRAPRRLVGQVMSAERVPIAGAHLLVSVDLPADELAAMQPGMRPLPWTAYTDRGGHFEIDSVPPGDLLLSVVAGEEGLRTLRVAADAPLPLTVQMEEGRSFGGKVLLPNGAPVAGTEIQLLVNPPAGVAPWLGAAPLLIRSDAHGAFHFRGVPAAGSFTCYAFAVRDGRGSMAMVSGDLASTGEVALTLAPFGGRL